MMTYLIIAVGMSITDQFSGLLKNTSAGDNLLVNALTIMSASMIFAFLCWSIPKTAAALMSGAPALTAGGAITGGVGMAAAVVAGGAMLAQAGKTGATAALNAVKGRDGAGNFSGLASTAQLAGADGNPTSGAAVKGLSGSGSSSGGNSGTSAASTAMSCTARFSAALLISNGRAVCKVHGEISEISEISAATSTCG
ncbi:MAG: hypothetical protein FWG56_07365 [Desulfovibrionaceae bacterium]|jgi:type IV secretory pathway TrbL component|nr:hypothetical protein [Desulfovibrionaceae bacterium]